MPSEGMPFHPAQQQEEQDADGITPNSQGGPTFAPEEAGAAAVVDQPAARPSSHSLPYPLRILFAFNGAIFILPNLALMSIVNDRAAIPPEYLPAYGAISFLPWSMKPLYAYLSTLLVQKFHLIQRHSLIAILLCASGLSFVGTAFVPKDGVGLCVLWGFVRGIASSWPEFLLGLTLIDTARELSLGRHSNTSNTNVRQDEREEAQYEDGDIVPLALSRRWGNSDISDTSNTPYEEIASVFQAQAATSRNVGSLTAGTFTFVLFAWRHYWHVINSSDEDTDQAELSNAVVTALLLLTAALPIVGTFIATKYKVGTLSRVATSMQENTKCFRQGGEETVNRRVPRTGRYEGVASSEDGCIGSIPVNEAESNPSPPLAFDISESDGGVSAILTERIRYEKREHRCYAAVLILFQLLLIFSSLKRPISSVTTHVAWLSVVIVLSFCLAAAMIAAAFYQAKGNDVQGVHRKLSDDTQVPAKRLALYLLLRHSLPSSGYIMYSFLFTIFESNPVYMQCLSILGSAGATFSSWFYGRCFAKKYSSGWGIIGIIVATTVIFSLASLLNIVTYHADDGNSEQGGVDMFAIIAPIYFVTGVVAELNFLPSLVLATTNIVATERAPVAPAGSATSRDDCSLYDEGMQYASFISCIDFGEQIGSWITVPIVASLDITRDNEFANLDHLILLCASIYSVSLVYLCLIRPPEKDGTSVGIDISRSSDNGEFT
mmetsp:Transcript_17701/g.38464  ORF Transcript_17701/g.38464 Transcript_17701/m.38464 type:complete len:719 (+) Transcript_17701:150-2306(+)